MANVKTAISIEKPLFEELEALAEELGVSRSKLFAEAARDLLKQHKNRKLLEAINAAYSGEPDAEGAEVRRRMKVKQRRIVKGQW